MPPDSWFDFTRISSMLTVKFAREMWPKALHSRGFERKLPPTLLKRRRKVARIAKQVKS
jgi:hypothetical protein